MNNTLIQIKIDNFEGPLDLLLHLIDKKQMKIIEINISQIIDDYLKYIKEQKELMNTNFLKKYQNCFQKVKMNTIYHINEVELKK